MKKRSLIFIISLMAVLMLSALPASAISYDLAMKIDGEPVSFDEDLGAPFIDGGRTMVPVRVAMESFGCDVAWNGSERSVTVSMEGSETVVKLFIGSNTVLINGAETVSDTAPRIVNNRTYLPIRFVLEAFGAGVVWSGSDRTIYVYREGLSRELSYEWRYPSSGWFSRSYGLNLTVDNELYTSYISEKRLPVYDEMQYRDYAYDVRGITGIKALVAAFDELAAEKALSDDEVIRLMISFVQSFEYVDDAVWTDGKYDEYVKYPYETLCDLAGDCEDTAILLYAMLLEKDYGCCLLCFDDHMAVGILGDESLRGTYFEYEDRRYYYVETTSPGWNIGEIPDEYTQAEAYLLF